MIRRIRVQRAYGRPRLFAVSHERPPAKPPVPPERNPDDPDRDDDDEAPETPPTEPRPEPIKDPPPPGGQKGPFVVKSCSC